MEDIAGAEKKVSFVFFKNARGLDNDGFGRLTLLPFHQYSRQRSIWYTDIDENKVWLYKIKYLVCFYKKKPFYTNWVCTINRETLN